MLDRYKAFIFDMDGTLVDSGQLHEVAWIKTLQRYEIPVDRNLMRSLAGVPTMDTLALLTSHFGCEQRASLQVMNDFKESVVREIAHEHVRATSLKTIAEQYQGRVAMSVGTGAYTAEASSILDLCQLGSLVAHIVGADRVDKPKPAPDTFLLCAELMRVDPCDCVVFEDSTLGLEAAERAGMGAIDVLREFNIVNDYFL